MPVIHGPYQGPNRPPGSVSVPEELFLWSTGRSRWAGTPVDIRSIARRLIEEVTQHHKLGTMSFVNLSINTPLRSWDADTPERLEEDLRVHRRVVRSVHLEVLVVQRGQVVTDVRSIPTKEWNVPTSGFYSEVPALPVYAAVTLSRTDGARLEVRSTTGLDGERIYDSLRPFLSNGLRWQVPSRLLVRPVRWLFPHFEIMVAGRTHWHAIGAGLITTVGLLGAVSAIAAGVKAGVDSVLNGGHDHHAAQLDRQAATGGVAVAPTPPSGGERESIESGCPLVSGRPIAIAAHGVMYGTVVLRYSAKCDMTWGTVKGLKPKERLRLVVLERGSSDEGKTIYPQLQQSKYKDEKLFQAHGCVRDLAVTEHDRKRLARGRAYNCVYPTSGYS